MIRFHLHCEQGHEFEAWFSRGEDYDRQQADGLLSCPFCDSHKIGKSIMAPAIATARKREERQAVAMVDQQKAMADAMREMVKTIRANSEDVGTRFAEEARRIHYGEAEARGIIGNAETSEVAALIDEGIEILPLPSLPDDAN